MKSPQKMVAKATIQKSMTDSKTGKVTKMAAKPMKMTKITEKQFMSDGMPKKMYGKKK